MACGLPVVAANCASGPAEILLNRSREAVHGITQSAAGAVVPPNDAAAFAEALRIVHCSDMRSARGAPALELSRRLSVERTAAHYWEIIENDVASRTEPRTGRKPVPTRETLVMGGGRWEERRVGKMWFRPGRTRG